MSNLTTVLNLPSARRALHTFIRFLCCWRAGLLPHYVFCSCSPPPYRFRVATDAPESGFLPAPAGARGLLFMPTEDRCKQIRHATATHLSALLGVLARAQTAAFLLAALFVLCAAAPPAWAAAATTTTLAVTSAGSPVTTVASKTVVALTATVTAGSTAVKPGQVNFCDATAKLCTDIHLLGTAQLTSAGTASMKFRPESEAIATKPCLPEPRATPPAPPAPRS